MPGAMLGAQVSEDEWELVPGLGPPSLRGSRVWMAENSDQDRRAQ